MSNSRQMIFDQIEQDAERLHLMLNGCSETDVQLETGRVPCMQKRIRQALEQQGISAEETITKYQLVQALSQKGLLEGAEQLIGEEGTPVDLKNAWQYANTFRKEGNLLNFLYEVLPIPQEERSDFFYDAQEIKD